MDALPYGKIHSVNSLGKILQQKRKQASLTQAELAALSGVGNRFISDLENGKPTLEIAKVFSVIAALGLELQIHLKGWG